MEPMDVRLISHKTQNVSRVRTSKADFQVSQPSVFLLSDVCFQRGKFIVISSPLV